jgi:hypothetical protein
LQKLYQKQYLVLQVTNEHPVAKVNAGLMMLNAGKIAPTKSTPPFQDDNDRYICSTYIM